MAKTDSLRQLDIQLAQACYPVFIGQGLLTDASVLAPYIKGSQVLLVSNTTIAPLYLADVQRSLPARQIDTLVLPDGEDFKTLEILSRIYDRLISRKHHRDTTIVALGGGVIGDICGMAAATYQRGVNLIQLPTSLLAQVDAAIGGKNGINHPQGKNMMGSFYQPNAVLIDTNTLETLPQRELRAGMAEVMKYAFLRGSAMWEWVADFIACDGLASLSNIDHLITESCRIKAEFVMADEKEQSIRALLNFGHTFAHALETATAYRRWLHGEAVAIGMVCALRLSYHKGYCAEALIGQLIDWLQRCGLPHAIPADIDRAEVLKRMWSDKKIEKDRLRFILCRSAGDCFISDTISIDDIQWVLNHTTEKCDG
ncbi:MAG: 3-dehydroquinate synthase [Legionellaceae bacterium]|nr:3-dehydroquinate synthase [Legionellaceae bacterium]